MPAQCLPQISQHTANLLPVTPASQHLHPDGRIPAPNLSIHFIRPPFAFHGNRLSQHLLQPGLFRCLIGISLQQQTVSPPFYNPVKHGTSAVVHASQHHVSRRQFFSPTATQRNLVPSVCQKRLHTVSFHRYGHRFSFPQPSGNLCHQNFIIKKLFHPLFAKRKQAMPLKSDMA